MKTMLMISEQHDDDGVTFKLAGALAGVWTGELERCWRAATVSSERQAIAVDLTEVIFVDDAGRELLALMAKAGADLIAGDVMMRSIVEEIGRGLGLIDPLPKITAEHD